MICRLASSRSLWTLTACFVLGLIAFPNRALAQLPLSSFDLSASPNPVPADLSTTLSATVTGISGVPDGSVDFYISSSAATCSADTNDIGTGAVNPNSGVATITYYAYTPGAVPICANYIPGPSGEYAAQTAGVYLLTVDHPATLTVQVPGAAEAGYPVNFGFTLSVPNGQAIPTGTITLHDDSTNQLEGQVTINSDGTVPPIDNVVLSQGYYYASYSGDTNYAAQYFYGSIFQENGLALVNPSLILSGSANTTVTVTGLNFVSGDIVDLATSTAQVSLVTTYVSPTQLRAVIPSSFLKSPGTLLLTVSNGDQQTNSVQVQVYLPFSDTITVSSNPTTFPYGTPFQSLLGATVARGATTDGGVPAGQITYNVTGSSTNLNVGTSTLAQTTTAAGNYVASTTPAPLDIWSGKMLSADFNRDGNADILSLPVTIAGPTPVGPYLQLMLSTGADTFATEQELYVGCTPVDFAIGDLNNDSKTDIVVACENPDNGGAYPVAEYLLGNGDGTFQAPVAFATSVTAGIITAPTQVAVGDFNGDGVLDVALIDGLDGKAQALFGAKPFDGTYTASTAASFDTTQGQVASAAAADFNRDGKSDIGLLEFNYDGGNGAVLVLTSNGSGGFSSPSPGYYPFSANSETLAFMTVTDVNGDGFPDIAVADPGQTDSNDAGQVIVFENAGLGAGNLGTLNAAYSIPGTSGAGSVAGAPFPVVGAPATSPVAPSWNLLYSAPDPTTGNLDIIPLKRLGVNDWQAGTTIATPVLPIYDGQTYPSPMVASDLNGDGYLDATIFGFDANRNSYLDPVAYSNDSATTLTSSSGVITPGSYSLSAQYAGNTLFAGGASPNLPITITPGTATGRLSGPSASLFGTPVTITATLAGVAGGAAPSGLVQFFDNGAPLGLPNGPPVTNPPDYTVSLTTSSLPIGLNTITVSYSGDTNYTALSTRQIAPLQINVSPNPVKATLTGPSTANPGEQPSLTFTISQAYPQPIQGTFTLTVQPPASGGVVDPAVQFSTGGTTFNFTIPAGTTTTPTVQLQTGTLAATITVTLTLTADGQDVTPSNIAPVVIDVPPTAPTISSVKLTRSGNSLTVTVEGFSSTRDMTSAAFDFRAANGTTLADSDVTVDLGAAFTTWYNQTTSDQFGSEFSYVQTFTLSNDSSGIQSVSVTLKNSIGNSNSLSAN